MKNILFSMIAILLLSMNVNAYYEDTMTNPQHLETCSSWTNLGLSDEDCATVDVSSFNGGSGLPFYGTYYSSVNVISNGNVQFGTSSTSWMNQDFPISGSNMAAPLWDDWNPGANGEVKYCLKSDRLVVEWHVVPHWSAGGQATFQAVVYDNGDIEFNYGYISDISSGVTVGLNKGDGSTSLDLESPSNAEAKDYNGRHSTLICYDGVCEDDPTVPEFTSFAVALVILLTTPAFAYLIIKKNN